MGHTIGVLHNVAHLVTHGMHLFKRTWQCTRRGSTNIRPMRGHNWGACEPKLVYQCGITLFHGISMTDLCLGDRVIHSFRASTTFRFRTYGSDGFEQSVCLMSVIFWSWTGWFRLNSRTPRIQQSLGGGGIGSTYTLRLRKSACFQQAQRDH